MHFDQENNTWAKCKHCKNLILIHGGTTSNLRRHSNTKHATALLEDRQAAAAMTTTSTTTTETAATTSSTASASTGVPATTSQTVRRRPIQSTLGAFVRRPVQPLQQSKVDIALIKMTVTFSYFQLWLTRDSGNTHRLWTHHMSFQAGAQFLTGCCLICVTKSEQTSRRKSRLLLFV